MKKMLLGETEVTVLKEDRGRVLFQTADGDKFVARRRFLKNVNKEQDVGG